MEQSGTSMASPVVAGAVALLISSVPASRRDYVNPASIKQVLWLFAVVCFFFFFCAFLMMCFFLVGFAGKCGSFGEGRRGSL
jgi:subtilisin family serine protease